MRLLLDALACTLTLLSCASASPTAQEPRAEPGPVTLEEAMADPVWIARSPRGAQWSADGTRLRYLREEVDGGDAMWEIDLSGDGTPRRLSLEEQAALVPTGGSWDTARARRVYTMHGDLFLADPGEPPRQLTRTQARESAPRFLLGDDRIAFERDGTLLVRELDGGLEYEVAALAFRDPPQPDGDDDQDDPDFLAAQQERLFPHLARRAERREQDRERARALREAVTTDLDEPFYLGAGRRAVGTDLSPDGRWLLVRVQKDGRRDDARRDLMPEFVTDSSWVETREVRGHVGSSAPTNTGLVLLDLQEREQFALDLTTLPGILEDPLAFLSDAESALEKPRPISIRAVAWAPDASTVVFQARSADFKDRWIARVDLATASVETLEHLHDDAWVQWRFSEMGWRADASGLWFLSEASGWSQLYYWQADDGQVRRLTAGDWEVDQVRALPDDSALLFRGNREHPGIHEVYRVGFDGGPAEQLTQLGGETSYLPSPDGTQLLLTSSTRLRPDELYLQDARPGAAARQLTDTVEPTFAERAWVLPEVVAVPSRHGRPIHARVYLPRAAADGPRPAVCFVHGAGYLQNAHYGWSSYVHEFLFHQLLVARGYVVIDADYRASAGYGRDWRTAIYRDMGIRELEDYQDCVRWLVAEHDVDAGRVGIYGGSYGGFVTLMALFRQPGTYAAGAALRPVTDWAHYHHGYTAPILNTPQVDPEAYSRSSPIEYAEGLEDALLICHGMVDDNVLAKDSIRLAQRLIELGKTGWDLALYPIEPHAFREPSSWLDEYRRILALFEEHLQ